MIFVKMYPFNKRFPHTSPDNKIRFFLSSNGHLPLDLRGIMVGPFELEVAQAYYVTWDVFLQLKKFRSLPSYGYLLATNRIRALVLDTSPLTTWACENVVWVAPMYGWVLWIYKPHVINFGERCLCPSCTMKDSAAIRSWSLPHVKEGTLDKVSGWTIDFTKDVTLTFLPLHVFLLIDDTFVWTSPNKYSAFSCILTNFKPPLCSE